MNRLLAIAIDPSTGISGKTIGNTFSSGINPLISSLLKTSLTIAGIIFLCLLIFGGFTFIMNAGGDPKKTAQSQAILTDAVIGFLVVILAYFIIQIIQTVTGLNILNSTL